MSLLRFLMLLSLIVWIGGLIFFAFVLAPTAFTIPAVLPNTHLAGNVVGRALGKLHWIGLISGVVFLITSLLYSRFTDGTVHLFATRHVLLCLMLALTLISQFGIMPRMDVLRASLGEISSVPIDIYLDGSRWTAHHVSASFAVSKKWHCLLLIQICIGNQLWIHLVTTAVAGGVAELSRREIKGRQRLIGLAPIIRSAALLELLFQVFQRFLCGFRCGLIDIDF